MHHTSYCLTCLTYSYSYVLLLHYLAETSQLDSNNFSNQSCTLLWHKINKKKYPVYPHSQFALEPKYHSSVLIFSSSSTQTLSLLCHSTITNDTALQQASIKHCFKSAMSHQRHCFAASINQALLQVSHVSDLCLIHTQCTIAPSSCFAHLSRLTDIINDTLSS